MKYLQYIIGILILCIILFCVDLKYAFRVIATINAPLLIAIGLVTVPHIFLKSLRWRYLLKLQGIRYGIFNSFVTYAKGIYFGMITPGRVGELIKVAYLKNERNVEVGEGFSNVLLDRFFDIYVLISVCIFSLLRFSIKQPAVWIFVIGIVIFIPFIFVAVKVEKVRSLFNIIFDIFLPKERNSFLREHIKSFYYGFKKIPARSILLAFILTLCIFTVSLLQYYFLSMLIHLNLSFMDVVFISSVASFVAVLPISFLGIGTREATLIYLFGKVGIGSTSAVIYSFLMFFSSYIMGAITGFLSWNIRFKKAA